VNAPLRIVFMGTAPLAAKVLEALLASPEFSVIAVVTQPDKPKGRDLKLQPSAVKELALARGLAVLQPIKARDPQFIDELLKLSPELIAVAAYGQILPQALLDVPRFGCLNVHTSILPKYRGAAPIQWAILNGDRETGVTIMKMDAGLDTGAVVSEERTPIRDEDNAQTLHDRLAEMGGSLLARTILPFVRGEIQPRPQPAEGATYARKITKEDGHFDWSQSAEVLWNKVRGLTPWPGCFTFLQRQPTPVLLKISRAEVVAVSNGQPGEVLDANRDGILVRAGSNALRLLEVQREGGKRLDAAPFLSGFPIHSGERFA
jgi:methionyl-tRNA formyltransferase